MKEIAVVVLGSNVGDRVAQLCAAVEATREMGEIICVSSLYESEPFGVEDQADFVNAALSIRTALAPRSMLHRLKDIERRLGRRPSKRWGAREIDLDIALFGEMIIDEEDLIVPHSGLEARDFFLVPIVEIVPDAVNPRTGEYLVEILDRFPDDARKIISKNNDDRWRIFTT